MRPLLVSKKRLSDRVLCFKVDACVALETRRNGFGRGKNESATCFRAAICTFHDGRRQIKDVAGLTYLQSDYPVTRADSRLISYLRDFINLIIYHAQIVGYRGQIFFLSKSGSL